MTPTDDADVTRPPVGDDHLDDVALAGHVLDDGESLTTAQQRHLDTCPQCRAMVERLTAILTVPARPTELSVPSPGVWQRIEQETIGARTGDQVGSGEPHADQHGVERRPLHDRRRSRATENGAPDVVALRPGTGSRWRRGLITGIAAALGVIAGVLGSVTVDRLNNRDHVVETVRLAALPGKTGHGTAQLVKKNGVAMLQVSVDVPLTQGTFHELWLINRDGRRMQDLGVLPPSGRAAYPLPQTLQTGLHGYTIVDVSLEPFDGNPAHSHNSIVRGQLAG